CKRAVPREAIPLAPATQSAPPQSQQAFSEHREAAEVSWYRVVVEVTLHDRLEPSSRLSYGIMHAPLELLLKLPQWFRKLKRAAAISEKQWNRPWPLRRLTIDGHLAISATPRALQLEVAT
ncbi:MAG: hypothetical protein WA239_12450, partial [Candidatus Sulfotelmatobacter sp.]